MQDFLNTVFFHNTIENWAISVLIVILTFIIAKLFFLFFRAVFISFADRTKNQLDDILLFSIEAPLISFTVLMGSYYGLNRLNFSESINQNFQKMLEGSIIILVTWFLARVFSKVLGQYIRPLVRRKDSALDEQVLPIVSKLMNVFIWILGIIIALNGFGIDVGALIAGMGIGGLAIAMAAKDTLSNFFGGVTILTDRPFKIGDRIKIEGNDGFIDDIGIRSTKMRTLEGRIMTIPNSMFSASVVENVTREPSRKVKLNLGLTYDTTPEKMDEAMSILEDIMKNDNYTSDESWIGFNSFGDFSLGIMLIYYIKKDEGILSTQTKVNREILKRFNEAGLSFAFPTQTIELQKA